MLIRKPRLLWCWVRCLNHWLSALSGCQRNHSQAISIRVLRTGALPALEIP
jgi:hypothetical protein